MMRTIFCAVAVMLVLATSTQAADDLTRSIAVSPDGHFLTTPGGEPFFWLGDTAWDLFQRPDSNEVDLYLRDRASKEFTIIQAVIGGVHGGANVQGEQLFLNHDPSKPNPKYFERVDWIIERAALHGLRLAIIPYWGWGIVDRHSEIGQRFTASAAEHYGQWLGKRYRHRGVVWILGGDVNPQWPKALQFTQTSDGDLTLDHEKSDLAIADFTPVYDALARGIVAGQGGTPLITYHPSCCSFPGTPQPRSSLYFGDREWLTMNMFQSSHYANPAEKGAGLQIGFSFSFLGPFNYKIAADEYKAIPARPFVDGEARFEDGGIDNDPINVGTKGFWTGYDARNAAYHSVFAGAAGHTYGNHSVWNFYDPTRHTPDAPARPGLSWREALNRPVSGQLRHLKSLMLSRPYFTRIPDQSLIVGDPGEGTAHIGATRSRSGNYAFIYLPQGQSVRVDMSQLSGSRITGSWYDPRTGRMSAIGGTFKNSGTQIFSPPSSGPENDWVLVLDDASKGFPRGNSDEYF